MIAKQYQRIIFGLKIKALRTGKGFSFADLSQATGMSVSYLNEIEKGKKHPKPEKITALAKALDTNENTLTSNELPRSLTPVGELLRSNFLSELPLDIFGIELQKIVEIISKAPVKVGAFISTLVELSKNYELQEESFYFGVMRAYQELHFNYFEELEKAATAFRTTFLDKDKKILSTDLELILEKKYGYTIDKKSLGNTPELHQIRSVFIKDKKTLLVQKSLEEAQLTLILAKELGFQYLNLEHRPYYNPFRSPNSFEPVLSNFKTTYFAAALLMEEQKMVKTVAKFCQNNSFNANILTQNILENNVTPETFMFRLTTIMPQHFQLKQLFFIRIKSEPLADFHTMDKVLHLNQPQLPHSNKVHEHYCRRWLAIQTLQNIQNQREQGRKPQLVTQAERNTYKGMDDDYLVVAMAIPAGLFQEKDVSVAFGVLMDDDLKKKVKFAAHKSIKKRIVSTTCERCAIEDCKERVAPPSAYEKRQQWKQAQAKLKELI